MAFICTDRAPDPSPAEIEAKCAELRESHLAAKLLEPGPRDAIDRRNAYQRIWHTRFRMAKKPPVPPVPLHGEDQERFYISGNLRRVLSRLGLHNPAAAELTGVDYNTLTMIVNGRECPTLDVVHQLAEGLRVHTGELLGFDPPREMTHDEIANVEMATSDDLLDVAEMAIDANRLTEDVELMSSRWHLCSPFCS